MLRGAVSIPAFRFSHPGCSGGFASVPREVLSSELAFLCTLHGVCTTLSPPPLRTVCMDQNVLLAVRAEAFYFCSIKIIHSNCMATQPFVILCKISPM